MYKWTYTTEIGLVTIGASDRGITYLKTFDDYKGEMRETELIQQTYSQLTAYLAGRLREFDIPLDLQGTAFQKKVWLTSCLIPYGETVSYKTLAKMIDAPTAIRAVGSANGANPIYIIIPCHRVIGTNGSLTGYGGGLDMKAKLLKLESE